MQRLIYVLIALTGLGLGVATYGGLAFSAVESATVALAFSAMGMTLAERTERRRSEARLDQGFQAWRGSSRPMPRQVRCSASG